MSKRQRERRTDRRRQAQRRSRAAIGASLALGAALAAPATGQAAAFTVTNTNASGAGSLADAINSANADATPDTIVFQAGLSGRIALNSAALPDLTTPATITGPGADRLTIAGDDDGTRLSTPLLRIAGASAATPIAVDVSGLTFAGGGDAGSTGGGLVADKADVHLSDARVTGNAAHAGAGLTVLEGSLTVVRTAIEGNNAGECAGGIAAVNSHLALSDSTLRDNSAGCGGGIFIAQSSGEIARSTISGNSATFDDPTGYTGGGAVWEYGAGASDHLDVSNTTVTGNHAKSSGGAFQTYDVSGRSAVTVASSTVVGNSADGAGGGLFAGGAPSQPAPVISNSIVAGNKTLSAGSDLDESGIAPFSVDFSLVQAAQPAVIEETVPGSNITGVSPRLTALDDNGGPTETMAPTLSSPVIDAGRSSLATDQRGLGRPVDRATANSTAAGANGADMGAVEEQSGPFAGPLAPPSVDNPPAAVVASARVSSVRIKGHSLVFKLTCRGAVCSGAGTIATTEVLRARTVRLARARVIRRKRVVGAKAYRVAPGKHKTVIVRLDRSGLKLLKRFRKLPVRLTVTQKQATGKPKTLKRSRRTFRRKRR